MRKSILTALTLALALPGLAMAQAKEQFVPAMFY